MSECYNNAIRLAKEHSMREQMLNLALKSTKADMISAAEYYESQGMIDKAVMLYHKGGRVGKALEMCFDHSLFQVLATVAEDLDETTDPELLQRAADICNKQGSYQLATKKYTQAGRLVQAMRSLLRCGDTDKIIFFANKCRQKEVYVMAANYLQSLDWRNDQEVLKNIVSFYTKGRALDTLASFYESCAQAEIDDYQDYEKALGALNEALRCMSRAKMKDLDAQEETVSRLQRRIEMVKQFVELRSLAQEDPAQMMEEAQQLLQDSALAEAVRPGDVYALMIEHLASREDYRQAYELMQDIRRALPRAKLTLYVSPKTIEDVHSALDIPLNQGHGPSQGDDGEIGEEIASEEV